MVLPIILILVIIIIILFHTGYVTLDRTMRELWSDHTWWKKIYIESLISDKKDKDQVLVRLLRNQDELGSAFGYYYGGEIGSQLSDLLKIHVHTVAEIVNSVKTRNQSLTDTKTEELHTNADNIIELLTSINFLMNEEELKSLLYDHLSLVLLNIKGADQEFRGGKVTSEAENDLIKLFDNMHEQIMNLSDTLTGAISKHKFYKLVI